MHRAWAKASTEIGQSYALDAIDHQNHPGDPVMSTVGKTLIEAVTSSQELGLFGPRGGEDVRLSGNDITVQA